MKHKAVWYKHSKYKELDITPEHHAPKTGHLQESQQSPPDQDHPTPSSYQTQPPLRCPYADLRSPVFHLGTPSSTRPEYECCSLDKHSRTDTQDRQSALAWSRPAMYAEISWLPTPLPKAYG